MIYLLQLKTSDYSIQLKTECTGSSISELNITAKEMVKNNPTVKGMVYRVFSYTKKDNKFLSKFLKEGTISK
jgi:hypothetical protein